MTGPGRHEWRPEVQEEVLVVEPKVKAATGAGAGGALVLTPFFVWLVAQIAYNGDTSNVPIEVIGVVGFVVTGVCTFVAGYYAKHYQRPV